MTDKPHHQKFEYLFLKATPYGANDSGRYKDLIKMYKAFEKAGWEPVGGPTWSHGSWRLTIVRAILKDKSKDLSVGIPMCMGHSCPAYGNEYGIMEMPEDGED